MSHETLMEFMEADARDNDDNVPILHLKKTQDLLQGWLRCKQRQKVRVDGHTTASRVDGHTTASRVVRVDRG